MQRYAFQIAYDGSRYFGFVRQPSQPTVEGELLKAFKYCGILTELKNAHYQVAARTDRGVNALCQVVALDVSKRPSIRDIYACLPNDIKILSAVKVQPSFDPRRQALRKHYRYTCMAPPGFNLKKARAAAKMLQGQHDFWNFCKHEHGKLTTGELQRVKIGGKKTLTFDFVGPAFLWQQVRRMVSALLAVGRGKLNLRDFKQMLKQHRTPLPAPAPPDGLVLVRVVYDGIDFGSNCQRSEKCANLLKRINSKISIATAK